MLMKVLFATILGLCFFGVSFAQTDRPDREEVVASVNPTESVESTKLIEARLKENEALERAKTAVDRENAANKAADDAVKNNRDDIQVFDRANKAEKDRERAEKEWNEAKKEREAEERRQDRPY